VFARITHDLEVIKTADWIIDLGPEGGDGGCEIVAAGPPEEIVREKRSYTGAVPQACPHPRRNVKAQETRRGRGIAPDRNWQAPSGIK
jgi:excinuclease ABC subunit A